MTTPATPPGASRTPVALRVGSLVVALQGLAVLVFAVLEAAHAGAGDAGVAVTTGAFFLLLAVGLLVFARALARRESWARGPVVAAELIELLTAYSFLGGETTPVAVVLAVVSAVVLVCVLHPASTRALADLQEDG